MPSYFPLPASAPAIPFDPILYGIGRVDLKSKYGARCDGTSHPLSGTFSDLNAALLKYPNAGLTSANWANDEIDTAACLQAEYELRSGIGGVIGIPDGSTMVLSRQIQLLDASKVWLHGGRGTTIRGEALGNSAYVRVLNAWGGETGPSGTLPLRYLAFQGFDRGRSSFGLRAGVASPGFANSAAQNASSTAGYRTGATAILIEGGPGAQQHSTNFVLEGLRWYNFDEAIKWGDNVFGVTWNECIAEGNNKGMSWSQATGLNSMENVRVRAGTYSNNNYGFYWNSIFNDPNNGNAPSSQGGSVFIDGASIDYNIVAQGVFLMAAPSGATAGYPGSGVHIERCHIENRPAAIGASSWFTLQGRGVWDDNEFYINNQQGYANPPGIVTLNDYSSGTSTNNRVGQYKVPFFVSTTSGPKTASGSGNEASPVGSPFILLRDANGTALQALTATERRSADYYQDLTLDAVDHGNLDDIYFSAGLTKLFLIPNNANSFRYGKTFRLHNKTSSAVATRVPPGVLCAGLGSYTDNHDGTSQAAGRDANGYIAGPTIPAGSMVLLLCRDAGSWIFIESTALSQYG